MKSAIIILVVLVGTLVLAQTPPPASTDQPVPDTRPVTGARNLSLGSDPETANQLRTSLSFTETGTSNARLTNGDSADWSSVSTVSGEAMLSHQGKTSSTDLTYYGGWNYYTIDKAYNTQLHTLSAAQTFNMKRWTLMLADHFDYEPDGNAGLPLYGHYAPDGADLRPNWLPDGTILTPFTTRLSNTGVAELDYSFSRKTSVTFSGAYGMLRFPDSDLLESNQRTLSTGLNHSYGRSTIGFSYNNTLFQYRVLPMSFTTHDGQVTYAYRLSRKVTFEAAAGPQVLVKKIEGVTENETNVVGHFGLHRIDGRYLTSLQYERFVSNGSGVTPGAKSDQVMASVIRGFGRLVTTSLGFGYARNEEILTSNTFNTFTAQAGMTKRLGRNASMRLAYIFQRQMLDNAPNLQAHSIMFTFTWAFNPLHLK